MADFICIYHGNCADGFTAAWVVRKSHEYLGGNMDNIEFYAGAYQTPPPDVKGKIVYMVDFSYKRPVMEQLVKDAASFIHIDHHVSAIKDMDGFDPPNLTKFYSYENTESGAMLAWKYFFKDKPVPRFIEHIDDRDRWQFLIEGTREVNANAFSYAYTFENWDMLMAQDVSEQIREGAAINRRLMKDTLELAGVVVRRMNIAGFVVPVANVPYQYGSEICNILCENEPFAAYYYDKPTGREFGLRSSADGVDVSEIAIKFGGGGHKHASGFRISYEDAKAFEL